MFRKNSVYVEVRRKGEVGGGGREREKREEEKDEEEDLTEKNGS